MADMCVCDEMQCNARIWFKTECCPQKMQTPVFDSVVPRKKMPMTNRLGNRQRRLERGVCDEGMDGRKL